MSILRRLRRKQKPKNNLVQVKALKRPIAEGTICEACKMFLAEMELMPHINGKQVGNSRALCKSCGAQTAHVVTEKRMTAQMVAQSIEQQKPPLGWCFGGPGCKKPTGSVAAAHMFEDPDGKGPPVPMCEACWAYSMKLMEKLAEDPELAAKFEQAVGNVE